MPPLDELAWEDVRVFLALARSTSFREAAARVGMTHPTVRRRLDALEAHLGVVLFRRGADGLTLQAQAHGVLEAAQHAEVAMQELTRRARAADPELSGPIRVSLVTELAILLAPDLRVFQDTWPEIQLIVETGNDFADLRVSGVDVAIRAFLVGRQPDGELVGRRVASAHQAVYGDPSTGQWIGAQTHAPQTGWLHGSPFDDLPVRSIISDAVLRQAACAEGMGIARLPCATAEGKLPRCTDPVRDVDIWVLVHPDLRTNPRLRTFRDAMVEALERLTPLLSCES